MPDTNQHEWITLNAKYATPPGPKDPRLKARRYANRRQARSRLQSRQVQRLIDSRQDTSSIDAPRIELTRAEQAVLSSRFASPEFVELSAARVRRLNERHRAESRLDARVATRRLQLDQNNPGLPSAPNPSYEQLAAAVLNLALETPRQVESEVGFLLTHSGMQRFKNLSPSLENNDERRNRFPTYAELAEALRNPELGIPSLAQASPGFPSYAQLNVALRNLSPETISQDQPSPGSPLDSQLAQALQNLSPNSSGLKLIPEDFLLMPN
ncbi:hypothetical protein PHYBOEH_000001 [Phytophthora boehmeriae]|uniref:Uncharacterized protein n=1 Tax=Phytophthora boehmeriae TaxID=109152 RepID=A0A8T1XE62_9STRA|nr:hypothetical protein PHYBOEH_000001 [Phytophthora boehmeriae]